MTFLDVTKKLLFATLLSAGGYLAAETHSVEIISDPQELQARGFDPEGPPIYRLSMPTDWRPLDVRIEEREQMRSPAEHGGYGVNWVTAQATDFQFLADQSNYSTQGLHHLSCDVGSNLFADASVHVANDRRLRFLDVWTRDDSASVDVDVALYQACQPLFTGALPVVTELGMIEGSGDPGERFEFLTLPAVYPQNSVCAYWVRAMFSSCSAGTSVSVYKARIFWDQ